MTQGKQKKPALKTRIEQLLARPGMSLEKLAADLNISLATLHRWKAGTTTNPPLAALRNLEAIEAKA